jgi:hypothetical protein
MSPRMLPIACSICFGAADGPLLTAARVGVLVLAVVTCSVLTALALFFSRIAKASRSTTLGAGSSTGLDAGGA